MEGMPEGEPGEGKTDPLPDYSHSAHEKGRTLAKCCLWSPFIGVAFWFIAGALVRGSDWGGIVVVILAFVLFAGGITLGIAALRRRTPEGRKGIVVRCVIGITLNVMLLCLTITVFFMGLSVIRWDAREKSRKAEEQKLEKKRIAELEEVNVEYKAEIKVIRDRYFANAAALTNHLLLDMAPVKTRAEIEARRQIVQNFVDGAKGMEAFATNAPAMYQELVDKRDLPPRFKKSFLDEFKKSLGNKASDTLRWRPTEVHYGELMLQMLDLFYDSWGHWKYSTARKRVEFQDAKALVEYNSLAQQIKDTAARLNELRESSQTNAATVP